MVEDPKLGVQIPGLTSRSLHSMKAAAMLVAESQKARSCGSTKMNAESSRSHTVLTLVLKAEVLSGGVRTTRRSHLNLVDLSGSERQKVSNTAGQRLKESISINSSLTSLGKVIDALVSSGSRHVPYRESKLTFFLKDSLGGNCSTCLIATVSPSLLCVQETISTLMFAQRAKKVRNCAVANVESVQACTIAELRAQVAALTRELEAARTLAHAAKRMSATQIEMQVDAPGPELSTEELVAAMPSERECPTERVLALEKLLYNTAQVLKQCDGAPGEETSLVIKGLAEQVCWLMLSKSKLPAPQDHVLSFLKHKVDRAEASLEEATEALQEASTPPASQPEEHEKECVSDYFSQASPNCGPGSPVVKSPVALGKGAQNKSMSVMLLRKIGKPVVPFGSPVQPEPSSPAKKITYSVASPVQEGNLRVEEGVLISPAQQQLPYSPRSPMPADLLSPDARKPGFEIYGSKPKPPVSPRADSMHALPDIPRSPGVKSFSKQGGLRVPLSPCAPNSTPPASPMNQPASPYMPSPVRPSQLLPSPTKRAPRSDKRKQDKQQPEEPSPKRAKLLQELATKDSLLQQSIKEVARLREAEAALQRKVVKLNTGLESMEQRLGSSKKTVWQLEDKLAVYVPVLARPSSPLDEPMLEEHSSEQLPTKRGSWHGLPEGEGETMRGVSQLQGVLACTNKDLQAKSAEVMALRSALALSEGKSMHMLERIQILEETRQNFKKAELVQRALNSQFQEQLEAKDLQLQALKRKEQLPDLKQVLTPIKQMMQTKQTEVTALQGKLASVMQGAKSHVDHQLRAASKRIKSLCAQAHAREAELTDKCSSVLSLEHKLHQTEREASSVKSQLNKVAAQEQMSFERIVQLQAENELLKEQIGRQLKAPKLPALGAPVQYDDVGDVHGSLLFSQLQNRDAKLDQKDYKLGNKWNIELMRSDIALYNMGFNTEAIKAQQISNAR